MGFSLFCDLIVAPTPLGAVHSYSQQTHASKKIFSQEKKNDLRVIWCVCVQFIQREKIKINFIDIHIFHTQIYVVQIQMRITF